jgi:FkbM family methyltransferase
MEFLKRSNVQLWNPFEVEFLPPLAAAYVRGYRRYPRSSLAIVLRKRAFRALHKLLRSAGVGGRGRALYHRGGEVRHLTFNARNTQFESIYMPHFAGGYEAETLALLDLLIGEREVFYDVGSNWGHFSLHVASRPGFAGKIHAFEPFPSTFEDLADIVRQAGLQEVVACHNLALSDEDGEGSMTMADGVRSGFAALSPDARGPRIRTRKLDTLDLPRPGVIKVDVEGSEAKVLAGGKQFLAASKPFIVMESWAPSGSPAEILAPLKLLEELGYLLFVPALLTKQDGAVYALPPGGCERKYAELDLALFRLRKEARFLFEDQINILACPRSRLDELAGKFECADEEESQAGRAAAGGREVGGISRKA